MRAIVNGSNAFPGTMSVKSKVSVGLEFVRRAEFEFEAKVPGASGAPRANQLLIAAVMTVSALPEFAVKAVPVGHVNPPVAALFNVT